MSAGDFLAVVLIVVSLGITWRALGRAYARSIPRGPSPLVAALNSVLMMMSAEDFRWKVLGNVVSLSPIVVEPPRSDRKPAPPTDLELWERIFEIDAVHYRKIRINEPGEDR